MPDFAGNLRRLIARRGLTIGELASCSNVDERTIRSLLLGRNTRPHARTLARLAAGLEVEADEFFRNTTLEERRDFDRQTNPLIDEIIDDEPRLFDDWSPAEFDELYSHFGEGGSLTKAGALTAAAAINRKRDVLQKVLLLLESGEADVFIGIVNLLYDRIQVDPR
jgi:transcriptional regulator with XRE-family HTH domain